MSWLEFWNGAPSIYVNARHKHLHYQAIGAEICSLLPEGAPAVMDFGCGETVFASEIAARCSRLYLCDAAPRVRERLLAATFNCRSISVLSPEDLPSIADGSLDLVIANSVFQYMRPHEVEHYLALFKRKLKATGRLVVADVVPRNVGLLTDTTALLRFARAGGFLLAAIAGLLRTFFSDYRAKRRTLGITQYDEPEMLAALGGAGFLATRQVHNVGHNQARMAFVALPRPIDALPAICGGPSPNLVGAAPEALGSRLAMAPVRAQPFGWAVLCFLVAWFVMSLPWLSGAVTIPYDAKALFQAQLQFLANAIHNGQSPFWAPEVFLGSPQIADPQSLIFSPALLLACLSPTPTFAMLDAYVLGLLGLAGLAVLMFFRDRGWHPLGGILAALAFAFGGSAAWRIQHIGQVQSYALLAPTLWLLARTLDRRSMICAIGAGICAGLLLIKPDQVALLGGYLLGGYIVWDLLRRRGHARRLIPIVALSAVTALLISSIPVLLTYLLVETSSRAEIPFSEIGHGSLHPASLLTAVIGDLYGPLDPKVEYWGPYSVGWGSTDFTLAQNMCQLYFGAVPVLALITVGFVRGEAWGCEIRYFTAAFLVALLYALGAFTPIFRVLYELVPGVSLFRRPADATFLVGGIGAIVAGHLVHLMATKDLGPAAVWRRGLQGALIIAPFVIALGVALDHQRLATAARPLALAAAMMLVSAAMLYNLHRLQSRFAVPSVIAIAVLMTADLRLNNGTNGSTALPVSGYDILKTDTRNETIQLLKDRLRQPPGSPRRDRVELVGLGFEWPNVPLVHGFDHVLGYNPLRLDYISKAIGAGDTVASWDQRKFTPLFPSYRSLLADLLGLRYVVTGVPIERIDKSLRPGDLTFLARTRDGFLYENPRAFPRVMFVTGWMHADFADILATGAWPPFDPRRTVLLEHPPAQAAAPEVTRGDPLAPVQVRLSSFENTRVNVDVTTTKPGFLLLNDAWHPWWRVRVDGREADLLRANVIFRAVMVPAGHHAVEFVFEPLIGALQQIGQGAARRRTAARPTRAGPTS